MKINDKSFFNMPMALIKTGLKLVLCDRGMFITDFFLATTLPFLVQYLVWSYVYNSRGIESISGYSYVTTITYYALAILIGRFNNGYVVITKNANEIHEGQLELRMARPFTLYQKNFFEFLGESLLYIIPVVISIIVCAVVCFKSIYLNPLFWILLILQLVLSQFLIFNLSWILAGSTIWLVRGFFMANLLAAFQSFFGGELLPVAFWPSWLIPILKYNPFYFINGAIIDSFLHGNEIVLITNCFYTLAYACVLFFIGKVVWSCGLKKYSGAGG
ncbi:MAG: ABC-2 family transporter protein [Pseudomonadota bacterium]